MAFCSVGITGFLRPGTGEWQQVYVERRSLPRVFRNRFGFDQHAIHSFRFVFLGNWFWSTPHCLRSNHVVEAREKSIVDNKRHSLVTSSNEKPITSNKYT